MEGGGGWDIWLLLFYSPDSYRVGGYCWEITIQKDQDFPSSIIAAIFPHVLRLEHSSPIVSAKSDVCLIYNLALGTSLLLENEQRSRHLYPYNLLSI